MMFKQSLHFLNFLHQWQDYPKIPISRHGSVEKRERHLQMRASAMQDSPVLLHVRPAHISASRASLFLPPHSLTAEVSQVTSVASSFLDLAQVRTFLGPGTDVTRKLKCCRTTTMDQCLPEVFTIWSHLAPGVALRESQAACLVMHREESSQRWGAGCPCWVTRLPQSNE